MWDRRDMTRRFLALEEGKIAASPMVMEKVGGSGVFLMWKKGILFHCHWAWGHLEASSGGYQICTPQDSAELAVGIWGMSLCHKKDTIGYHLPKGNTQCDGSGWYHLWARWISWKGWDQGQIPEGHCRSGDGRWICGQIMQRIESCQIDKTSAR